jgi:pimeloyl-ACP methyl ester carboxylesterase
MSKIALLACAALLLGCGDDGEPSGPRDWTSMEVPDSTVPVDGVRRDVIRVPGFVPPANPDTGDATPADYNATQLLRYRVDVEPPAEADAILVAYPGFLGGGASWEILARHLVREAGDRGLTVEVWAIDRRSNLLEDLRGLDTAEAAGNPEIAYGYHFGVDTIDGERFPGFLTHADVPYMSEWGLETHVEDLRRVIEMVPEADRKQRVFLMGHSLGASFAEAYAAWRFADGSRGVDQLAGLVLIDGILSDAPITEEEYTGGTSGGFFSNPGLDGIRAGDARYFELPFFGVRILASVEILSLRALLDPDGVVDDEVRDDALRVQLQLGADPPPPMTNAAALGWGFDDDSNGIVITAVSCGEPIGPTESYRNGLAMSDLLRPADREQTYDWTDATEASGEWTPLANLAESFVHGRTNFAEWYFPMRLPLDLAAVGGAAVADDGWQAAAGLRAFDGALIDAPILAFAADLVEVADYDALAARVAPVGSGRPNAGATRDQDAGLRTVELEGATHVDPLAGAHWGNNVVPDEILDFVAGNLP